MTKNSSEKYIRFWQYFPSWDFGHAQVSGRIQVPPFKHGVRHIAIIDKMNMLLSKAEYINFSCSFTLQN